MKAYTQPQVLIFGSVEELTQADFTNNQVDSIFNGGTEVGNAQGSQDACVSGQAQSPDGTCYFP